ncbi:MAG: hypothetical protein IKN66_08115 [Ruminococcus sp.]|nr:hypothetical protein [Ruminococcus sp.]
MNFFTDELKKITDRSEYIHNPKFVGKSCVFRLSDDVTGKLEFVTGIVANHYNSLRLKLFNKSEGPIDTQLMGIGDIIGNKKIYSNIQSPYIWKDGNNVDWYGYKPTDSDYSAMSETVDDYLSCFAEQELTESEDEELNISLN